MAIETKYIHLLLLLLASFYVRRAQTADEDDCPISDDVRDDCIRLPECQYAMDLIEQHGINSPEAKQFLENNRCGFEGLDPKVCCPSSTDQGNGGSSNNSSLLPDDCGHSIRNSNRVIGGEATEIGEFPWMAMLEYLESGSTLITGCGGSLISKRYVLTAAHCIRNTPSNWQLKSVRLGEHNVVTNPDCANDGYGSLVCADPILSVPIEKAIVHESYGSPVTYRNDIALLRLTADVSITKYIRPICLPSNAAVGESYWSAGWGQTNTERSSEVKLKVKLPYVDFDKCAATYKTKGAELGEGQICAGGVTGKDTCKGDSGGPLMKQETESSGTARWFVNGVVSFGHTPCGVQGWPGVYTEVHNYVPWIISNLRP